ncbi:hypothetical protein Tco_1117279 [Tanacetum coccineum]
MHRTTPSTHRSPTLTTVSPQKKKRKQIAGETSSPRKSLKVTIRQKQQMQKKLDEEEIEKMVEDSVFNDDDDSGTRIGPESYKENPKTVDDDDDETKKEKKDEKIDNTEDKDNDDHIDHALVGTQEMGSMDVTTVNFEKFK